MTVFAARMPLRFLFFYGKAYRLDKKLKLPARTAALIREQVASINTCRFCMDTGRASAMKNSPELLAQFDTLPEYRTSPLFSDAERAALDYATELTADKDVRPETFERLARHYSEREICDIAYLVASEHLSNLTNVGFNIGSDGLCELNARQGAQSSSPAAEKKVSSTSV